MVPTYQSRLPLKMPKSPLNITIICVHQENFINFAIKIELRRQQDKVGNKTMSKTNNKEIMKTKGEVMAMMEANAESWVAIRTNDNQGNNESYDTAEVSAILDDIDNKGYEFSEVVPAAGIDIDVWAQGFDSEIREGLRKDLENGDLYIARFRSDEYGDMDLLIWD